MYKFSDGGKAEAGIAEKNDCAVRAYSIFTNTPYADAHQLFKDAGRKNFKGTPNTMIRGLMKDYVVENTYITINELRRLYPNRRIYALKRGHAFTMINGVIYDSFKVGNKSKVTTYWLAPMTEAEQAAVAKPVVAPAPVVVAAPKPQMDKEQKQRAVEVAYQKWKHVTSMYRQAKYIAEDVGITHANAMYYVMKFNKQK